MPRTITVKHDGKTYSGRIGRIQRTFLGKEDHGIFTAFIDIAGPSWAQATPPRGLDLGANWGYGLDYLGRLVETVGAPSWEELRGCEVIALYEGNYPVGLMNGIAHVSDESKVLIFEDHAEQWRTKGVR